jgi:membrane associated rhomboid family serine protease
MKRSCAWAPFKRGTPDHQYWRLGTIPCSTSTTCLGIWLCCGGSAHRRAARRLGGTAGGHLISVVAAGVAIVVARMSSPHPGSSLGASGGVFGLLACALVLLHRPEGVRFGRSMRARLALWLIVCIGVGMSFLPGVSFAGHAGGLLVGLLAGSLLPMLPPTDVSGTDIQAPKTARPN